MEFTVKKGLATLTGLSSESLNSFNEENGTKRVKLTFSYVNTPSEDATSLDSLLQNCSTEGGNYSIIIELSGLGETELQKLKDAVLNHEQANFSTVICSVSQITNGEFTVVNNGKRDYSTLSNSYLGLRDEQFLEGSAEALRSRLLRQVEDDVMNFGSVSDAPKLDTPKDNKNFVL